MAIPAGFEPANLSYGRLRATCRVSASVLCLVLRDMRLAVVIPLGVTPCVAFAVVLDGPDRPMRLGILPLHFSQFVDEIDAGHGRLQWA